MYEYTAIYLFILLFVDTWFFFQCEAITNDAVWAYS